MVATKISLSSRDQLIAMGLQRLPESKVVKRRSYLGSYAPYYNTKIVLKMTAKLREFDISLAKRLLRRPLNTDFESKMVDGKAQ
jgi:hypothetical protein